MSDRRDESGVRPDQTTVPRQCTLDGFAREADAAHGVGLSELDALTTLVVRTLNSSYRVIVLEPPRTDILIQGGTFFSEPTRARLAGASLGGGMLKLSWLGCGLRMEICWDGQRIVTSPVQSIAAEDDGTLPGPF